VGSALGEIFSTSLRCTSIVSHTQCSKYLICTQTDMVSKEHKGAYAACTQRPTEGALKFHNPRRAETYKACIICVHTRDGRLINISLRFRSVQTRVERKRLPYLCVWLHVCLLWANTFGPCMCVWTSEPPQLTLTQGAPARHPKTFRPSLCETKLRATPAKKFSLCRSALRRKSNSGWAGCPICACVSLFSLRLGGGTHTPHPTF
jgi:hypothetical protein